MYIVWASLKIGHTEVPCVSWSFGGIPRVQTATHIPTPQKMEASLCPAPPPGAIIGMGTPGGELSTCPKSIK